MAALIKRSGKWWIKYYPVTGGKPKWVKGYSDKGSTRDLAIKLENEKTALQRGDLDPHNQHRKLERVKNVQAHIDAYKTFLQAKGCNPNHISYTIADIKAFFSSARLTHATAVQRQYVDTWILTLKANDDSPRTINRRVGAVQSFLKHLHRAGVLTDYVLQGYPKQKVKGTDRRKRRALSAAESEKLMAKAPAGRRKVYRFAALTGFRFSEIASLTAASFHLEALTSTSISGIPASTWASQRW